MIPFVARLQRLAFITFAWWISACRPDERREHTAQEQWTPPRQESSDLSLIILYSRSDGFAMRPLVRVEARQREGGGFQATLLGDSTNRPTNTSSPVSVPIHGKMDVRVVLVAPGLRGDTLARSSWTTIQLEPAYNYWVAVSVGDSAGPIGGPCAPHYTSYPIARNSVLRGDSLLVDIQRMAKTTIC